MDRLEETLEDCIGRFKAALSAVVAEGRAKAVGAELPSGPEDGSVEPLVNVFNRWEREQKGGLKILRSVCDKGGDLLPGGSSLMVGGSVARLELIQEKSDLDLMMLVRARCGEDNYSTFRRKLSEFLVESGKEEWAADERVDIAGMPYDALHEPASDRKVCIQVEDLVGRIGRSDEMAWAQGYRAQFLFELFFVCGEEELFREAQEKVQDIYAIEKDLESGRFPIGALLVARHLVDSTVLRQAEELADLRSKEGGPRHDLIMKTIFSRAWALSVHLLSIHMAYIHLNLTRGDENSMSWSNLCKGIGMPPVFKMLKFLPKLDGDIRSKIETTAGALPRDLRGMLKYEYDFVARAIEAPEMRANRRRGSDAWVPDMFMRTWDYTRRARVDNEMENIDYSAVFSMSERLADAVKSAERLSRRLANEYGNWSEDYERFGWLLWAFLYQGAGGSEE